MYKKGRTAQAFWALVCVLFYVRIRRLLSNGDWVMNSTNAVRAAACCCLDSLASYVFCSAGLVSDVVTQQCDDVADVAEHEFFSAWGGSPPLPQPMRIEHSGKPPETWNVTELLDRYSPPLHSKSLELDFILTQFQSTLSSPSFPLSSFHFHLSTCCFEDDNFPSRAATIHWASSEGQLWRLMSQIACMV